MKKILVTGGAGYIGSHMVAMLVQNGYQVVVLDNLSTGFKDAVLNAELIIGDLADKSTLDNCFKAHDIFAVMHFAASVKVKESVFNPSKYYQNNVVASINLLNAMQYFGVKKLIFSSSAAVYGEPQYIPVSINHPKNPINSYGRSKWLFEEVLKDYDSSYQIKSIVLRYFNAAGADPLGRLGPREKEAASLIPCVLQVALKKSKAVEVFGFDYTTPDGTCVRDYVHVTDLCRAHLLALKGLINDEKSKTYNLGNAKGYSVLEVIKVAAEVTGKKIPIIKSSRRAGDPASLVADTSLACKELLWKPVYPDLTTIIQHAWQWENINASNF